MTISMLIRYTYYYVYEFDECYMGGVRANNINNNVVTKYFEISIGIMSRGATKLGLYTCST